MRIVIGQATGALGSEIALLEAQSSKCQQQINQLGSWSLDGLSGESITAEEQRVRMRAAIARTHLSFYGSLAAADRQNMALVQALPTTTSGVLDTAVAQDRINRAQLEMRVLNSNMEDAVSTAAFLNWQADVEEWEDYVPISLDDIRGRYQSLISSQQCIVSLNEQIIQRANEYEAASQALYAAVSVDILQQAVQSASSYLGGGGWGSTAWVTKQSLEGSMRSISGAQTSVLERFIAGDLVATGTVAAGSLGASTTVAGIPLGISANGELLDGSVSVKPYGTNDNKTAQNGQFLGVGVEAKAKGSVANASLEANVGRANASLDLALLTGSVEGKLGGSLFSDGQLSPSISAKASAKGSVLEETKTIEANGGVVTQRVEAKGSLLTASAEAGGSVGVDGIEGKVGAEAYVAKGELTNGLSILGVTVDVTFEGKAGGAGANASGKVGLTELEGALGLGLGLGLSAKVKVDWSDLFFGLARNDWSLAAWWDELMKEGEAA